MLRKGLPDGVPRAPFLILAGFVGIVFVLGGSSRNDILPLLVLRPLSVIACGYGLSRFTPGVLQRHRSFLLLWAIALLLVAMQLVPLPPAVWQGFPGRALLAGTDRVAGLGAVWRPLSLAPDLTWNSLFALATPLAATLVLLTLPIGLERLCWVFLAAGLVSGLLGLLQLIGTVGDSLSYYQPINNQGSAVGLFANRNHSAVFLACLFPILASLAAGGGLRRTAAAVAAIALIPLIVATGSRAGLLIGGASLVLSAMLLLTERARLPLGAAPQYGRRVPALAIGILAMGILALTVLAAFSLHGDVWNRLLSSGSDNEKRLRAWPVVVRIAWQQMPFGSGYGAFDPVFRVAEPMDLLSPTYFNHAHNDWLELWMTGGAPALAFLAVALTTFGTASYRVWRREAGSGEAARLGRLGSVIVLMLALASLVDYPLRTPSLSTFGAVAAAWLVTGQRRGSGTRNRKSRQHAQPSLQVPGI